MKTDLGWLIRWHIIWPRTCRRQADACTRVFTQTRTHAPSPSPPPTPPGCQNAPEDMSGSQVSAVTQEVPCYLRSCPLSSEATSSMWTWSHSCKMEEMEKRADVWKGSVSERSPCTGRPGLLRGACGEEGSKITTHKSVQNILIITNKLLLGIKDEVKVSASDKTSYCCPGCPAGFSSSWKVFGALPRSPWAGILSAQGSWLTCHSKSTCVCVFYMCVLTGWNTSPYSLNSPTLI